MNTSPSFRQAVIASFVFTHDYEIVGHPELEYLSIGQMPRQDEYNVFVFPQTMKQEEAEKLAANSTWLLVTCMDKDVSSQAAAYMRQQFGSKGIVLTLGGGIIQDDPTRQRALHTILAWIAEHAPNLKTVHIGDHNCGCGAVKFFLTENHDIPPKAVYEHLACQPQDDTENLVMKRLITYYAQEIDVYSLFDSVQLVLHDTNRKGSLKVINFEPVDSAYDIAGMIAKHQLSAK